MSCKFTAPVLFSNLGAPWDRGIAAAGTGSLENSAKPNRGRHKLVSEIPNIFFTDDPVSVMMKSAQESKSRHECCVKCPKAARYQSWASTSRLAPRQTEVTENEMLIYFS